MSSITDICLTGYHIITAKLQLLVVSENNEKAAVISIYQPILCNPLLAGCASSCSSVFVQRVARRYVCVMQIQCSGLPVQTDATLREQAVETCCQ